MKLKDFFKFWSDKKCSVIGPYRYLPNFYDKSSADNPFQLYYVVYISYEIRLRIAEKRIPELDTSELDKIYVNSLFKGS